MLPTLHFYTHTCIHKEQIKNLLKQEEAVSITGFFEGHQKRPYWRMHPAIAQGVQLLFCGQKTPSTFRSTCTNMHVCRHIHSLGTTSTNCKIKHRYVVFLPSELLLFAGTRSVCAAKNSVKSAGLFSWLSCASLMCQHVLFPSKGSEAELH